MKKSKVTIIGPAIVDIMAGHIGENIFRIGSMPMNAINMTYGGNGRDYIHWGADEKI